MVGGTILDRLKHDPETRHIPVHVISGDDNRRLGLALGAMTFLEKTVTRDSLAEAFTVIRHSLEPRTRKILFISREQHNIRAAVDLLEGPDVEIRSGQIG